MKFRFPENGKSVTWRPIYDSSYILFWGPILTSNFEGTRISNQNQHKASFTTHGHLPSYIQKSHLTDFKQKILQGIILFFPLKKILKTKFQDLTTSKISTLFILNVTLNYIFKIDTSDPVNRHGFNFSSSLYVVLSPLKFSSANLISSL